MIVEAITLKPGDRITAESWGDGPIVTILRDPVDAEDRFGQPLKRFWSRREDTGAEGFMSYGRGGHANRI